MQTDVWTETWIVNNRIYEPNTATRNIKGELIDTGIKVSCQNFSDEMGNSSPSEIWTSPSYRKDANIAEREDKK